MTTSGNSRKIYKTTNANLGAAATYTKWVSEWTEKWTKAVDNMDASEIAKYAERMNQILEKAANAAY